MNLIEQIKQRRLLLQRSVKDIADVIGMNVANVYRILGSERDIRASTLEAFADALDAKWVLVPRHLMAEVERLQSGKSIGPDEGPSSVELLLGSAVTARSDTPSGSVAESPSGVAQVPGWKADNE